MWVHLLIILKYLYLLYKVLKNINLYQILLIHQKTHGQPCERPNVIAPTWRLCAMPPTSSSTPECQLPITEVSTPLIDVDHSPSSQMHSLSDLKDNGNKTNSQLANDFDSQPSQERTHDHPLDPEDEQQSITSWLERRAPNHSSISESCCFETYVKTEQITQPLHDPNKATTKLGIVSDAEDIRTIMPLHDQEDHNPQLHGSENPQEDLQRLHHTSAQLSREPNASYTTKVSVRQCKVRHLSSPRPLHSSDSQHLMASEDSYSIFLLPTVL